MTVSDRLVFDRELWAHLRPEIRRWEDAGTRKPGKKTDKRDPEEPRRRGDVAMVRRTRNRLAYEAIAAGIPTVVISDETGITVKGIWERVRTHAERNDLEMPDPPPVWEKPGPRRQSYTELVADYGVLYDAWAEVLEVTRQRADRPEIVAKVAYYARQGGLPYKGIADALGYSTPHIRDMIHNYAEAANKQTPRRNAAVTARPGQRRRVTDGAEPPGWLAKEVRGL